MSYELHPLCRWFPPLVDAAFDALRDDIKANGLRSPIVVHEGMILDGGNRYRACLDAGIEPRFEDFAGNNIVHFVLSANLHRRHMTPGQQASIVASAQDWAKAQTHGGDRRGDQAATLPLETVQQRAALSGAGERTQRMADQVAKADPELAKQVAHGAVSLPTAHAQVSKRRSVNVDPSTTAAQPAAQPSTAASPVDAEPEDSDIHAAPQELLETLHAELRACAARIAEQDRVIAADDKMAHAAELLRRLEHSERTREEAMAAAVSNRKRADYYEKLLSRCGKAVGQRDLGKVAPAVEAAMRAAKKGAQ